jgi:RecA/RadA recombinase
MAEMTRKDRKNLDGLLDSYGFNKPQKSEDGTLSTARYKTDVIMFDLLMNGGLPQGKIITLGAEEGIGKTTMLIEACANIVKIYNKKVYYIDAEGGATYELFDAMGHSKLLFDKDENPDGMIYRLPMSIMGDINKLLNVVTKDPETAVVVIDSDTAVIDGRLLEEEDLGASKSAMAANARMWSQNLPLINEVIKRSQVCLAIIHQARTDLSGFFAVTTAKAGRAAKHFTSVEVWGKKIYYFDKNLEQLSNSEKDQKKAVGAYIELSTKKNRLTMPFARVRLPIFFGKGTSKKWAYKEWLEVNSLTDDNGEVKPFLEKRGAGYWYLRLPSGEKNCRGDQDMWKMVSDNVDEIEKVIEDNGGFDLLDFQDN